MPQSCRWGFRKSNWDSSRFFGRSPIDPRRWERYFPMGHRFISILWNKKQQSGKAVALEKHFLWKCMNQHTVHVFTCFSRGGSWVNPGQSGNRIDNSRTVYITDNSIWQVNYLERGIEPKMGKPIECPNAQWFRKSKKMQQEISINVWFRTAFSQNFDDSFGIHRMQSTCLSLKNGNL